MKAVVIKVIISICIGLLVGLPIGYLTQNTKYYYTYNLSKDEVTEEFYYNQINNISRRNPSGNAQYFIIEKVFNYKNFYLSSIAIACISNIVLLRKELSNKN